MKISDGMQLYAILHPETYQVRRYVVAHRQGVATDVRDCLYPNFLVETVTSNELPDSADVMIFPAPRSGVVRNR